MVRVKLDQDGIKFCFFTDVHLSAKPPGRRVDDYSKAILGKLNFTSEWCHDNGYIGLCGGDVFHVKSATSVANPHVLINKAMETFQTFPGNKVYGIVGNHDVTYDDVTSLPNQPLGVLIQSGSYERINEPFIFEDKNGLTVEVVPFDFGNEMSILNAILDYPDEYEADYRIGVCHGMARTGGAQELFGHPIIGYNQLQDANFDILLWGHDHSFIPKTRAGNVVHIHPGSMARAAFSSDETDRTVHLVGIEFHDQNTCKIKTQEIPTKPIEATFRTVDVDDKDSEAGMQDYLEGVRSKVGSIEIIDALQVIEDVCAEDHDMKKLILEVCEY